METHRGGTRKCVTGMIGRNIWWQENESPRGRLVERVFICGMGRLKRRVITEPSGVGSLKWNWPGIRSRKKTYPKIRIHGQWLVCAIFIKIARSQLVGVFEQGWHAGELQDTNGQEAFTEGNKDNEGLKPLIHANGR